MDACTGVRGTWMRAAAIPVGAQTCDSWPCTAHQRQIVSSRKLFPVLAEAWITYRAGFWFTAMTPVISR